MEKTQSAMNFDPKHYDQDTLINLYKGILLPRLIEDKMLILLRQNKISKWFSGIGQEAIAVGLTMALQPNDYIMPLHRNLGVFTSRNMPLKRLFCQWQGKMAGYTKGRDRSFHFGSPEDKVIGMISHLGSMLSVACGTSLASNLNNDNFISLAFSGDGGASEGEFHEAINTAAVWNLPVIFLVENNGYGLSTPSSEQFRCKQFIDKAIGYGIEGVQVDGNNILEVYDAVLKIAEKMRVDRKPIILEAMTFRMRGHEEASGTKYVPKELQDAWAIKDPVQNYENFLLSTDRLSQSEIDAIKLELKELINDNWQQTMDEPEIVPNVEFEMNDVYAYSSTIPEPQLSTNRDLRFIDAISEALYQSMEKDDKLVLMGQDIADYGGVFKITNGFMDKFGKARVRNTPLCESAIVGAAMGLTLEGHAAMVEMQFADFVSCAFNQIVNNLAKTFYRWDHPVNVTVRMPTGAGGAAGPFHSQSNEAWFFHVPGLKIVYPSNPYDAKGLLTAALADPNPVMYFEHKSLYRSLEGKVPEEYYQIPIGKAKVVKEGTDVTIVAYGMAVNWALNMVNDFPDYNIEIVDLRTLLPWDQETVFESVKKTGKCLVFHEDTITGGIGAEIAAVIGEKMFTNLDAPVFRVGSLDSPIPFNADLEKQFLPVSTFKKKLQELLDF